ncbi:MAG: putative transcriptional regulator [Phycisphaerales bacterium]|nr:putative transcriptional regulator [Phycisphaerales bacterium]MDB5357301.1 putative transcriptional regulator [Phycisphaerales bacterium]
MRNLGMTIRTIREARQLSLSDVASAAGVGAPFLSLLERNERSATPDTLQRVAAALRVPRDLLFLLAGFAKPGAATDETVTELAKALDKLEKVEAALRRKLGATDVTGQRTA